MSETEKQEGQKTVVAFIAGLLIGGLLVWVFSSSEEPVNPALTDDSGDTEIVEGSSDTSTPSTNDDSDAEATPPTSFEPGTPPVEIPVGEGSISVSDQPAGNVVVLDEATFPNPDGWVAVRDYTDGNVGGILGAARFSASQGLLPTEVEIQRPIGTEAGRTYAVVFFTEDGGLDTNGRLYFDPAGDQQIEGVMTTFTAQ